jgi:hypothetical protein
MIVISGDLPRQTRWHRPAVMCAALLSACMAGSYPLAVDRCMENADCPSGHVCSNGECVATPVGDAGDMTSGDKDGAINQGSPDAGMLPDAASLDAAYPDAGYPDAVYPDAEYPDAAYPDAGYPDAAYPDAGGSPDSGMSGPVVSASMSQLLVTPSSAVADGVDLIMINLRLNDTNGYQIPGIPVSVSATGVSTTFSTTGGNTNGLGFFETTVSSSVAQSETIVAVAGGVTFTAQVQFIAGPPDAANSSMMISPRTVAADGASAATVTVTLQDAFHNPVSGEAITLTVNPMGVNELGGSVTNAAGVYTTALTSTVAGTYAVSAETEIQPPVILGGTVIFANGVASASTSTLTASPSTITAGASTTITITVKDAEGNPVPGVAVSLSSTGSGNIWSMTSGLTSSSGVFSATFSSTKAETKTITATIGPVTLTTTITVVGGSPSHCTLVASPTSAVANGSSATTLVATIQDAYGNPDFADGVSFSASPSAGVHFSTSTAVTNSSGVATTDMTSTVEAPDTVIASAGSCSAATGVNWVAGPISTATSSITAAPTNLPADGVSTSLITVMLLDANENPIPGQIVTMTSTGTSNTFNPAAGTTNASGVFVTTLASTVAETKTVTANAGSASLETTVTFESTTGTDGSDPCSVNNGGCSASAVCNVVSGTAECGCPIGYISNGQFGSALACTDPCSINNGGCNANATCSLAGQFVACTCDPGFVSSGQSGTALTCTPAAADGGTPDAGPCGDLGEACCEGTCTQNGMLVCAFNQCVVDYNWTHWSGDVPDIPPASQYVVSSDGTMVTDSATGLVWQRTPDGEAIWSNAYSACEALSLGGFSTGWRLPTVIEALSLMDFGVSNAALNLTVFSSGGPTGGGGWTSTVQGSLGLAWQVDLGGGYSVAGSGDVGNNYVGFFCVRSSDVPGVVGNGPGAPPGRYQVANSGAGDGTVHDVVTGLTWQQSAANEALVWSGVSAAGSAQAYCAQLSLGAFTSGWRLPTAKELASIVDVETSNPAIDSAFLASGPLSPTTFWTAAADQLSGQTNRAVSVDFEFGALSNDMPVTSAFNVRCVR